ncbi:uncharacterized protein EI97DRAFT_501486 [Westerdykella ornata]|uniref:BHLH domain-containing protein n=1 Tax=Westerdykella ornata TaxID=318751 RepID=A0A6A6JIH4_WESOR|nr:uncharacterized protein EI97DRAFT_501486 [Westerdykella ornata]KAF2276222.1 hypothetical protein EI97DRAFT_501486 [Westerdykella ornata]
MAPRRESRKKTEGAGYLPTPASSTLMEGKTGSLKGLDNSLELPPAALDPESSASSTVSSISRSSDSTWNPPSPESPKAKTVKGLAPRKKPNSARNMEDSDDDDEFLPQPPTRQPKIIQTDPQRFQHGPKGSNGSPRTGTKRKHDGTTAQSRLVSRKTSHREIEKKRRGRINNLLDQMKDMIPTCRGPKGVGMHKEAVLEACIKEMTYLKQVNEHLKRDLRSLRASNAHVADTLEDRDLKHPEADNEDEEDDEEDEEMREFEPQTLASPWSMPGRSRESMASAASTHMSPKTYAKDSSSTPASPNFSAICHPATSLQSSVSPVAAPTSADLAHQDGHTPLSSALRPFHTSPSWAGPISTFSGCSAFTPSTPAPQSLQEDHQIATEALLRLHSDPRKWDDSATTNLPPQNTVALASPAGERGPRGLTIADLLSRN